MILYFELNVNDIIGQGKEYKWPRPEACPKCGGYRLWGHGYVQRYFDMLDQGIWLKRYRCIDCGGVHTLRPKGYWRRFTAQAQTLVKSIGDKIAKDNWQQGISRQRQQYWYRGFKKQMLRAGKYFQKQWHESLVNLVAAGIIVCTHSMLDYKVA